ncbi:MAG: sigma-70 family RNA polymerase sigma factor [Victivallales bacterium]|nr:sigma-70 family RNA polymerase sigma factor [Victivallales bacterium]
MGSDNDTMKLYMQNIGQFPLVSPQEEIELAARIKTGDEHAREKLIRSNLRLVVKIAHDFKGLGLPLLDLISEGNIGLMRAVEKFDPSKGAKLSSYAAWWIKQSMRRALANQARTIRIPVQSASKISKIQAAKAKLAEQLGRDPTNNEIASEVNLTERTVMGLVLGKATTISLHEPIQHGEDGEYRDIIPDEKSTAPDELVQDEETLTHMLTLTSKLEERERRILELRFGLNGERTKTLEEVSQTIGRTRERVRQIQNQALDKLKALLEEDGILQTIGEPEEGYEEGVEKSDDEIDWDSDESSVKTIIVERKPKLDSEEERRARLAAMTPLERERALAEESARAREERNATMQQALAIEMEKQAAKQTPGVSPVALPSEPPIVAPDETEPQAPAQPPAVNPAPGSDNSIDDFAAELHAKKKNQPKTAPAPVTHDAPSQEEAIANAEKRKQEDKNRQKKQKKVEKRCKRSAYKHSMLPSLA